MKMERMIGILSILLQKEQVTAPELARRFEVSRRTIQRDVESLCRAGIPLVTTQGAGGGISIMEGYRMERTLITAPEMQAILTGLRSLDSVSGTRRYAQLMEKLSPETADLIPGGAHMLIDLSSWYKSDLAPKIELIQRAIEQSRVIQFNYFSPKGETQRSIEPYYLIFQWSSWYAWGWCCTRQAFRLFKLVRMTGLSAGDSFAPRPAPRPDLSAERFFVLRYPVTVVFRPEYQWRLVEEYGVGSFTRREDGRLHFAGVFSDEPSALDWLLTFGDGAEVLEPPKLRGKLAQLGCWLQQKYERRD